jgi:hypothetical protein
MILKIEKTVVLWFHAGYKIALAIQLKERKWVENILNREHELVDYIFSELGTVPILKFWQSTRSFGCNFILYR